MRCTWVHQAGAGRGRRAAHVVFLLLLSAGCAAARADRLLLQVEEFEGPWRRQTNIPGYLGTGFCTSNANPKIAATVMRKTVRIERGGPHAVWLRGYTSGNSRRAMQVEVGGKRLAVTHKDRRRRWLWQRAGEVDLPAGEAAIVIRDADVGFETADAVLLTDRKDDDPMAEERNWWIYPGGLPDRANALRFNIDAILALTRKRKDPTSKEEWESRRGATALALRRALGLEPWPAKTPLGARVVARAERDGYTIENVVFESRPKFYVPANVYVPKGAAKPLPAVIVTAGHAMQQGKNYDLYRTAQLGLVRLGFLVLAYDPIGQGERRRRGYSHTVGYAALTVGQCNIGYMTWDTIRALDYLLTRKDVDPKRIGTAGNSGGGLNAFYAMPVEPRLAAGGSFCFACSIHAWIKDGGNHCICSHLPRSAREMEHFEVVGLTAPRALLVGNGAKDGIFPIAGTRDTIRRARRIYAFAGAEDRLALRETPQGHGWSQSLREACYGWMCRWLQSKGDGSPIAEPKIALGDWRSKELQCLKDGKMPADAKSYLALVREEALRLIAAYPPVPAKPADRAAWAKTLRERLWEALGGRPAGPPAKAKALGEFTREGHTVERLAIQSERALEVPALLIRPKGAKGPAPAVVFLDDGGKAAVRTSAAARTLLGRGVAVLAMDPRALGEVAVHANHCASDSVVLGRPLLAQQAWDVICAARCLAARKDVSPGRVAVYGRGSVGLIALLAGALTDDFCAVAAEGAIGSFTHAISDPLPQPLWAYAPGIVTVADVPHLLALCAPRAAMWTSPVGLSRKPLSEAAVRKLAAPAAASYRAAGADQALAVLPGAPPDGRVAAFIEKALRK